MSPEDEKYFEAQINQIFETFEFAAQYLSDKEFAYTLKSIGKHAIFKDQAREFYFHCHNKEAYFDWINYSLPQDWKLRFSDPSYRWFEHFLQGVLCYADTVVNFLLYWSHHSLIEVEDLAHQTVLNYFARVKGKDFSSAEICDWFSSNLLKLIHDNKLKEFLRSLTTGNLPKPF